MRRVFNFSAGPATLPLPVLSKAREELLDYHGHGLSVMEMSHRSTLFTDIIEDAEVRLRRLLNIPDSYHVLFLQGGATSQFSMVPMNLLNDGKEADYMDTGEFARKAIDEAERFGRIHIAASSRDIEYTGIPITTSDKFNPDAAYCHITSNNTIYGTRFSRLPETGSVPLVSDMSSCLLSERIDIEDFGLIYAGAQKNIGPAGLTIVIIRKDLVGRAAETTPIMFNYRTHVDKKSLFNTPPCYSIYVAGLMLAWLEEKGGLEAMEAVNREKAKILYDCLDSSNFYSGTAEAQCRSLMNVTFRLKNESLTEDFVSKAESIGLTNLKGHRSVGGVRASIYNAMPVAGVSRLVSFMREFELENR